jgi:hypothetical protein
LVALAAFAAFTTFVFTEAGFRRAAVT